MSDILKKICDVKVQEVAAAKKAVPFAEMRRDAKAVSPRAISWAPSVPRSPRDRPA
jgi:hypothetical protein